VTIAFVLPAGLAKAREAVMHPDRSQYRALPPVEEADLRMLGGWQLSMSILLVGVVGALDVVTTVVSLIHS
jgi:hypothetical protein